MTLMLPHRLWISATVYIQNGSVAARCSLPHQQLDDIYLELIHLQSLLQGGDAIEILYSFQQLDYLFSHLTKADALSFGNIF